MYAIRLVTTQVTHAWSLCVHVIESIVSGRMLEVLTYLLKKQQKIIRKEDSFM